MWWTMLMAPRLSTMYPVVRGPIASLCCTGKRRCLAGKRQLTTGVEGGRLGIKSLPNHSQHAGPKNSPFKVKVLPTHDASKVKASGPGLNTTGVPASLPVEFTIDAKDAGEGLLAVQITVSWLPGPVGLPLQARGRQGKRGAQVRAVCSTGHAAGAVQVSFGSHASQGRSPASRMIMMGTGFPIHVLAHS